MNGQTDGWIERWMMDGHMRGQREGRIRGRMIDEWEGRVRDGRTE